MKRKLYKRLLEWKTKGAKKSLMVVGARQVGKTYLIREFCKAEFKEYLEFNLFDRADIVSLFAESINTQLKIDRLELLVGHPIDFERTALFFDEAQESEELNSALKFFAESETPYKIICAGSLLGVKIRRFKKSFPVGKVTRLHLRPMDFEEFLMATGDAALAQEIYRCYRDSTAMSAPLHEKCLERYRLYLCSGGMPEAVSSLVGNDLNILRFDSTILAGIRADYLNDMNRYIDTPFEKARIEATYASIPAQLGNKSSKFQYTGIRQGAKSREYASALDWLVSSDMILRCEQVTLPQMPLKGFVRDGFFKLYYNDVGLLGNALGIAPADVMLNREFFYKGILVENYVANQMAAGEVPLFYWRSNNEAEVDFLLDTRQGIVPVEVKAGEHKGSPSLRSYRQRYNPVLALRFSTRNFGLTGGIKSVPLYAAFCLGKR
jgi:predicted AAA+ superfamily ATPase